MAKIIFEDDVESKVSEKNSLDDINDSDDDGDQENNSVITSYFPKHEYKLHYDYFMLKFTSNDLKTDNQYHLFRQSIMAKIDNIIDESRYFDVKVIEQILDCFYYVFTTLSNEFDTLFETKDLSKADKKAKLNELKNRMFKFYDKYIMKYMNKFFAVINYTNIEIVEIVYDKKLEYGYSIEDMIFRSKPQFNLRIPEKLTMQTPFKKIRLNDYYFNHPDRQVYKKTIFTPNKDYDDDYLNLFTGFKIDKDESALYCKNLFIEKTINDQTMAKKTGQEIIDMRNKFIDDKLAPLLNHVKSIWCSNNEEYYNYVLNWMAHLLQLPHKKTGVSIVLKGREGSGKGIIIQKLAKIMGERYYKQPNDMDEALGKFALPLMETCILLFLDEMVWGGDKKLRGKLMKLITEEQYSGQKKGKDIEGNVHSYLNIIMSSNEQWVVPASKSSRRFFVLETSNIKSGIQNKTQEEYFKEISDVDPNLFANFLYNRDISSFNPAIFPVTESLREQKELSLDPVPKFWHNLLCDPPAWLENGKGYNKKSIYIDFKEFSKDKYMSDNMFWKETKQIIPYRESRTVDKLDKTKRIQTIIFDPLEECKKKFREFVNDPKWKFDNIDIDDVEDDIEEKKEE